MTTIKQLKAEGKAPEMEVVGGGQMLAPKNRAYFEWYWGRRKSDETEKEFLERLKVGEDE